MADGQFDDADGLNKLPPDSTQRVVYVIPEREVDAIPSGEIDLRQLLKIIWAGKWSIFVVTFVFIAASVAYALLATEWYRAEVLLAPAEEQAAPSFGGLGGFAALAGVSIGGRNSAEAVATLKARDFAKAFIEDHDLLRLFFAEEWDVASNTWQTDNPKKWPDVRDGIEYFQKEVINVIPDSKTGFVTLEVEWKDPDLAAQWAGFLVDRLNQRLRESALREAEENVGYLREELATTNLVTLQQTIGRLLESELQKLMLARGNEEFAFRVIDGAQIPKRPVRPRRILAIVVGTFLGGLLGVFGVIFMYFFRSPISKS